MITIVCIFVAIAGVSAFVLQARWAAKQRFKREYVQKRAKFEAHRDAVLSETPTRRIRPNIPLINVERKYPPIPADYSTPPPAPYVPAPSSSSQDDSSLVGDIVTAFVVESVLDSFSSSDTASCDFGAPPDTDFSGGDGGSFGGGGASGDW